MSRANDGTYTAPTNSFNPAVEGTAIDETDWNAILDDIETALTDSLSVSGKGKVTAHIDFDENGSPGTPASNVGRLYAGDDSGLTTVYWKDAAGNTYNLLQGAASGLTYQFDTSTTTSSDPGAGKVRFNSATLSSVTEIAVDDTTAAGSDVSAYVLTWDDAASSIKGTVFIQKRTSPSTIAIFNITGTSTDETGWTRLAVTYVTHNGSFSSSDPISVSFAAAGTGTNGAPGATGPNTGLDYAFNTATSGDPGSGKLLFNSATIASVTQVNISETGRNSEALAAVLATWDDSTNTTHYGHLRIFDVADRTKFIELEITGTLTDAGSYRTIPVTYTAGGTLPSNNAVLAVMFERTGNKGADGAGSGDVTGAASSVDGGLVLWSGNTGKALKTSATDGIVKITSNIVLAAVAGTDYVQPGGALGTPSSGTLTNATGLPISTGVSGLGTGVATFLATPSSANLAAALTDETGTGAAVFANSPTLVTPALGTPSSLTLTNATGLPASALVASTTQAVGFGSIELGHATDTTLSRSAAGELAVEGTIVKKVGKETIGVPSGAMTPRTTNGAARGTVELTTNDIMLYTLDFDTTTEEGAGFWVPMPKSYNNSTVTFQAAWTAASGSGGVAWGLAAYAFSDDDAMDTAVSGQQIVTDTLITANDLHLTSESSAITIGGTPASGDWIYFEVTREVANGSDTLGVDARLLGIRLFFTTNASTDA